MYTCTVGYFSLDQNVISYQSGTWYLRVYVYDWILALSLLEGTFFLGDFIYLYATHTTHVYVPVHP